MKTIKIIYYAVFVGLVGSLLMGMGAVKKENKEVIHISNQVIRFHVRANSDSDEDQTLKLLVKEEIVEQLQPLMAEAASVDESRRILSSNLNYISSIAQEVLLANGCDDTVTSYLSYEYFPVKAYGDLVFPSGDYEALRVDIGQAEGKNWWCVMYPNLCFVDATHGVVPSQSKQKLKNVLTEEEYNTLLLYNPKTKIKVKFKFLEKIKEWMA